MIADNELDDYLMSDDDRLWNAREAIVAQAKEANALRTTTRELREALASVLAEFTDCITWHVERGCDAEEYEDAIEEARTLLSKTEGGEGR